MVAHKGFVKRDATVMNISGDDSWIASISTGRAAEESIGSLTMSACSPECQRGLLL